MAKKTTVCRRNFAELLAAGVGGGESISSSPSRAWRKVPAACFVRHKLRRALLHVQLPSFDRANSNKKSQQKIQSAANQLPPSFYLESPAGEDTELPAGGHSWWVNLNNVH